MMGKFFFLETKMKIRVHNLEDQFMQFLILKKEKSLLKKYKDY
jgi:hypothetical protein